MKKKENAKNPSEKELLNLWERWIQTGVHKYLEDYEELKKKGGDVK